MEGLPRAVCDGLPKPGEYPTESGGFPQAASSFFSPSDEWISLVADNPWRRLPSLSALRAFDAAARHGSFKSAADELSVTPSAVSHQIGQLEEELGFPLFRRLPRRTELTEAGRHYQSYVQEAFARLVAGTDTVRRRFGRRVLVVQVYVSVAVRWLIPRLPRLDAAGLDLTVRLHASPGWEFDEDGSDIGLVSLRGPRSGGIRYTPMFDADLAVLAAPTLAAGLPAEPTREALVSRRLLQVFSAPDDWSDWFGLQGLAAPEGAGALQLDSYLLALEAAADGQGLAVAPLFLAADDIRRGRLVACYPHRPSLVARWYLASRRDREDEPAILSFRDWLTREVAADPHLRPVGDG
jgi:LysR family glycine cleavage system transcriptional activator